MIVALRAANGDAHPGCPSGVDSIDDLFKAIFAAVHSGFAIG